MRQDSPSILFQKVFVGKGIGTEEHSSPYVGGWHGWAFIPSVTQFSECLSGYMPESSWQNIWRLCQLPTRLGPTLNFAENKELETTYLGMVFRITLSQHLHLYFKLPFFFWGSGNTESRLRMAKKRFPWPSRAKCPVFLSFSLLKMFSMWTILKPLLNLLYHCFCVMFWFFLGHGRYVNFLLASHRDGTHTPTLGMELNPLGWGKSVFQASKIGFS